MLDNLKKFVLSSTKTIKAEDIDEEALEKRIEDLINAESQNLSKRLPFLIGKVPKWNGEGKFYWDAAITNIASISKVGHIIFTRLNNNRIKLSLKILVTDICASGESYVKVGFISSTKNLQVSISRVQFGATAIIDLRRLLIRVEELKLTNISGISIKRGFAGFLVSAFVKGFLSRNYIQNEINRMIEQNIPIVENLKPELLSMLV